MKQVILISDARELTDIFDTLRRYKPITVAITSAAYRLSRSALNCVVNDYNERSEIVKGTDNCITLSDGSVIEAVSIGQMRGRKDTHIVVYDPVLIEASVLKEILI